MRALPFLVVLPLLSVLVPSRTAQSQEPDPSATGIAVTSPAFADGGSLPARYTCDGDGESPPIAWSNIPLSAKSLVLIVRDPDAPRGTFVHWVVYNIPPTVTGLPDGAAPRGLLPAGAEQGKNGKDETGWTPLCPPWGRHHYDFHLYALSDSLVLTHPKDADIMLAMSKKVIGQGQIVGAYERGGK